MNLVSLLISLSHLLISSLSLPFHLQVPLSSPHSHQPPFILALINVVQ